MKKEDVIRSVEEYKRRFFPKKEEDKPSSPEERGRQLAERCLQKLKDRLKTWRKMQGNSGHRN